MDARGIPLGKVGIQYWVIKRGDHRRIAASMGKQLRGHMAMLGLENRAAFSRFRRREGKLPQPRRELRPEDALAARRSVSSRVALIAVAYMRLRLFAA